MNDHLIEFEGQLHKPKPSAPWYLFSVMAVVLIRVYLYVFAAYKAKDFDLFAMNLTTAFSLTLFYIIWLIFYFKK